MKRKPVNDTTNRPLSDLFTNEQADDRLLICKQLNPMRRQILRLGIHSCWLILIGLLGNGCRTRAPKDASAATTSLASFQERALQFKRVLTVPKFEATPQEIQQSVSHMVDQANAQLAIISGRQPREATFNNTIRALDDADGQISLTTRRLDLLMNSSTNRALRETAAESLKTLSSWYTEARWTPGIYAAVNAVAGNASGLNDEEARLLKLEQRRTKLTGSELIPERRELLIELHKKLGQTRIEFDQNLNSRMPALKFTRDELEGVPSRFLRRQGVKTGKNEYTLDADTDQIINIRNEETRKRLTVARLNRVASKNAPLLQSMVECRNQIAQMLGCASSAELETSQNMAGSVEAARDFCEKLALAVQPRFAQEINEMSLLKVRDTGKPGAKIEWWDVSYYSHQLDLKGNRDLRPLWDYFPYDRVLEGLFELCQQVFQLKIERITTKNPIQAYCVSDSTTHEPLGLVFIDPYKREGKIQTDYEMTLVDGRRLSNGQYQCPVVVVYLHLPHTSKLGSLRLSPCGVQVLFHEFGHALREILGQQNYRGLSPSHDPPDFAEVPSEFLELWARNKQVLESVSGYYRDPRRKLPQDLFDRIALERNASIGCEYRHAMAQALVDLELHTKVKPGVDSMELANQKLTDLYLPVPEGTAPASDFDLLTIYPGACYSHDWCKAIAADLASVFENSPKGFLDPELGLKLRREIYESGGTSGSKESIERFLGRAWSTGAFFKELGVENADPK